MAGRGTDIKPGGNVGKLSDAVKNLGGLFILGTERHDRRIDNQLRGRSGRQGDPGASVLHKFKDELMRIFGGDQIDGMLKNWD